MCSILLCRTAIPDSMNECDCVRLTLPYLDAVGRNTCSYICIYVCVFVCENIGFVFGDVNMSAFPCSSALPIKNKEEPHSASGCACTHPKHAPTATFMAPLLLHKPKNTERCCYKEGIRLQILLRLANTIHFCSVGRVTCIVCGATSLCSSSSSSRSIFSHRCMFCGPITLFYGSQSLFHHCLLSLLSLPSSSHPLPHPLYRPRSLPRSPMPRATSAAWSRSANSDY